ncbi:MAG: hypothetical protein LBG29_09805, partial [Synergistaceae bacterium]|nr:hypothetical protein [Synergistaceae bacterium]
AGASGAPAWRHAAPDANAPGSITWRHAASDAYDPDASTWRHAAADADAGVAASVAAVTADSASASSAPGGSGRSAGQFKIRGTSPQISAAFRSGWASVAGIGTAAGPGAPQGADGGISKNVPGSETGLGVSGKIEKNEQRASIFKLHEVPADWSDSPGNTDEWSSWPPLPTRYKVPQRSEVHRRRGVSLFLYVLFWPALFVVSTISFIIRRSFAFLGGGFAKSREDSPKRPAILGYIPVELFIALSFLTFGLYPFSWLRSNSSALASLCGNRLQDKRLRLYALTGFCLQLLLPVSLGLFAGWHFTGDPRLWDFALRASLLYVLSGVLIIIPQRCCYLFNLRWNIRRAVESWDKDGVMIARTMASWLKLFIFGSAYIQFHANRLIGLGMPGFAGQDEIMADFSVKRWLNEYVMIRKHPIPQYGKLQESGNE